MKKLLVIVLIALATCATVEESSDDNVILEKSGFSIKHTVPHVPSVPKTHKINIPKTHVTKTHKIDVPKTHKIDVTKTHKIDVTKTHKIDVTKTHKIDVTKTHKIDISKLDKRKNLGEAKKLPIKGVNGLFGGKVGEIFRKLGEMVKKGIAWLKKNKLWDPIIEQLKNLGQKYGNELCEKVLSPEICGPAIDFALEHLLPSGKN